MINFLMSLGKVEAEAEAEAEAEVEGLVGVEGAALFLLDFEADFSSALAIANVKRPASTAAVKRAVIEQFIATP